MTQAVWKVKAITINRNTRVQAGKVRTELVGTNNLLFRECKTHLEVEETYECFWNDLNPRSREIVKVISVEDVKQ